MYARLFAPLLMLALAAHPSAAAQGDAAFSGGSRWGANYFPNVPLTTHEGKKVRFFDDVIEGKVVMINFIYTSCPDSCPMETGRMLEIQGILGDRVGQDIFMYSISIDPETDTPEVLARYAERYQAGPGWTFLTGKEEHITLLRKKLGLYIDEIQGEDSNDHNLSLIIGNQASGIWKRLSPFENPYILAGFVGDWLHNWKKPRSEDRSYAEAPELRNIGKGEALFRRNCSGCHTIGPGDGLYRAGPNLLGVTDKRDPQWLDRWLAAPDKMLEAKDPVALELFEAYNGVQMPNIRLSELERRNVIEYLATESRRVELTFKIEAIEPPQQEDGATCCQKQANTVLSSEPEEDPAAPGAGADGPLSRFSIGSWVSVGAGFLLGLFTLVLRLRAVLWE
ncbi:MAG: electron transporter SenC [Planctomycetes bacterium]|jgi:protein SCO1/2|nr:electron transporter SenC [Planctomycetota bacterium]